MNCETCEHHKLNPQGGHCYMFERQPIGWCGLHKTIPVALLRPALKEKES